MIFNFAYSHDPFHSSYRSVEVDDMRLNKRSVNFNFQNYSLDILIRVIYSLEYWIHNPKHYGKSTAFVLVIAILHDDAYSFISELVLSAYQIRRNVHSRFI